MYHRKPEKYKEYHNQENACVGYGELPYIKKQQAWRTPNGYLIHDYDEAITYATYLDKLYRYNARRVKQSKTPYDCILVTNPKGKPMDTIQSIINWFKIAKPNPTTENIICQTAYHLEEVVEMLQTLHPEHQGITELQKMKACYLELSNDTDFQKEFHETLNHREMLDALCDQIVTALGVGYMLGYDMKKALDEVSRSNWSKLENGRPIRNEDGKIINRLGAIK